MNDPHFSDGHPTVTTADLPPDAADQKDRLVLSAALRVGPEAAKPKAAAMGPQPPEDAALRALVRAVLREELQGDLGERITRGVRKLVRAEVAALVSVRKRDPEP